MLPKAAPPFHDAPIFGAYDAGIPWRERPGAYGITHDEAGRILIVEHEGKRLLPGGGIDGGETAVDALVREVLEETGLRVTVGRVVQLARYYYDPQDGEPPSHKLCRYHLMTIREVVGPPLEADHRPLWLSIPEARDTLFHAVDRWVVAKHGVPPTGGER